MRLWLDDVPEALAVAAARWELRLRAVHDAGWTSVVVQAVDASGRWVLIKVTPDAERYALERTALMHWQNAPVVRLIDWHDDEQLLLLELVAGVPGGGGSPPDHPRRVAAALSQLHAAAAPTACVVPLLSDHYRGTVRQRIERRAERFGAQVGADRVACCLQLIDDLCRGPERQRMLHTDLYAENVLFDRIGDPVFIDPHPRIGSPAFDWAFWCVYYVPTRGFTERVALCAAFAPAEVEEALAWSMTLAVDGALYYLEQGDEQVSAMLDVLDSEPLARGPLRSVGYPLR